MVNNETMTIYAILPFIRPWFLPPGLNILLAIVGFCCYLHSQRLGKLLLVVSFISLWLCSAPIFSYNLIEILQNKYPSLALTALDQPPAHSAIVVLGGGDFISIELGNKLVVSDLDLNRLRYAVFLHKKTRLPLVVSGGHEAGASQTEADLMLQTLKDTFGVEAMLKEDKSNNTADEAKFLAPILKQKSIEVVYLVTNAWHMPRSVYSFREAGIQVIPAPMGYEVYDHHYTILSYLPDLHALAATSIAIHEFAGLLYYRWKVGKHNA